MSIYKSAVALLIMQGINYLVPLIALPYLTHTLGSYHYGVLSTALIFVQYIILIIDFGFNLSTTKKISENRDNITLINKIYWDTIVSKFFLFIISFLISLIIILSIEQYRNIFLVYLFCLPQIIGSIFFPIWLFQGMEKIKNISILIIVPKVFIIPLLLIFVKNEKDINYAALILSLPLLISAFLSFSQIKKLGITRINTIRIKDILSCINGSFHYFIGSVAISVYTLSTPIILSLASNYQEVGYYSAADKLRVAMLGVFLILGQVIYPRSNMLLSKSKSSYNIFIKKLIIYQIFICSIFSILFFVIVPDISLLLLGSEFENTNNLIKIMSPMILLIPLSVILANCIILPHGKSKAYAIIPWITVTLHLPYAYILCKNYGALGGSISILITEIISFLFLFIYCLKMGFLKEVLASEL